MVCPHLTILWHGEDNPAGDSARSKKEMETEEDNIKEWTGMEFGDSLRQRKTGKDGKVLLQSHLWCPDDLRG